MDIFDLENNLPDEIMASTSQPANIARNNFRIIPSSDGNINKLRIRVEPMTATTTSTQNDQSISTSTSLQAAANSSSSFLPQSATNSSTSQTISTQSAATSSSNYAPQLRNMHCLNPRQSVYPATSAQPVDMSSSSFLPQSQTHQYVYPGTSLQPAMSSTSFSPQSQSNQSANAAPATFSSTSLFSPSTQNNQSIYRMAPSRSATMPCPNPLSASQSRNQSAYIFSPMVPTTPRYYDITPPSYLPTAPRYYPPPNAVSPYDPENDPVISCFPSSTPTNPQYSYVTTGSGSSNQPRTMERKIDDMRKKWLGDHGRQTQIDSQVCGSVAQAQSASSSSSLPSTSQNVQAIVAGLKQLEKIVPKTSAALETPFGQQSQNRGNTIAMNLVQNTTSTANDTASSPNKTLATSAEQNVTKEWQKQVNTELREHLVGKLVQTVFPNVTLSSSVRQGLKSYIEKAEREIYENSNSKNEYYFLLAEKNYKIQKEIDKKRLERKEQQLQQQQLQHQQLLRSQQDIEMTVVQPPDGVSRSLDKNSNISENQSSNTTSGASHILSLVNNVSTNKQKHFTKEWHKQIGAELREILVKEFVQKMLPISGSEAVINNPEGIDDRIKSYAKNVECDIYQKADSRIEYYDLLADKYCKMQEELRKGNFAALNNS